MTWHSHTRQKNWTDTFLPSNATRCCRVKINGLLKMCPKKRREGGNRMVQWMLYKSLDKKKFWRGKKAPASTWDLERFLQEDLLMFHDLPFNCSQLRSHLPFLPRLWLAGKHSFKLLFWQTSCLLKCLWARSASSPCVLSCGKAWPLTSIFKETGEKIISPQESIKHLSVW